MARPITTDRKVNVSLTMRTSLVNALDLVLAKPEYKHSNRSKLISAVLEVYLSAELAQQQPEAGAADGE